MAKKLSLDFLKLEPKEIGALSAVVLVLAFAFSYKFRGPFSFGNWFGNFLLILILVTMSLAVHEIAHRCYAAYRHLAKITSRTYIFGLLTTIIITIISNGWIVFAAPWVIIISSHYTMRPGRKYQKWHLGPYDSAKIALTGSLASLGLAIIAKLLIPALGYIAEKLIFINVSIAIFNLLPISAIFPFLFAGFKPPRKDMVAHTEGDFVFFGSRPLWAFTFFFVLVAGLSLFYLSALVSILLALTVGAITWLLWYYFVEGAKPRP